MTVFMPTPAHLLMCPGMKLGATRWVELDSADAAPTPDVLDLIPTLLADLIEVGRGDVTPEFQIRSVDFRGADAHGRVRLRARVVGARLVDGFVDATLETTMERDTEPDLACVATASWRFGPVPFRAS